MKLGSISDIWMHKPNTNQKWLLGTTLTIAASVFVYFKFIHKASTPAPVAEPKGQSQFTGGFDCYNSYLSADGTNPNRCRELNDALMLVRTMLKENEKSGGQNLRPAQITTFKAQEMQLLAELQNNNCK